MMDFTDYALVLVRNLNHIELLAFGDSHLIGDDAKRAEEIRVSIKLAEAAARDIGAIEGQPLASEPDDEFCRRIRSSIPGVVRCGQVSRASGHEIAFSEAVSVFSIIGQNTRGDRKLIDAARFTIEKIFGRNSLTELEAAILIEGEVAGSIPVEPSDADARHEIEERLNGNSRRLFQRLNSSFGRWIWFDTLRSDNDKWADADNPTIEKAIERLNERLEGETYAVTLRTPDSNSPHKQAKLDK